MKSLARKEVSTSKMNMVHAWNAGTSRCVAVKIKFYKKDHIAASYGSVAAIYVPIKWPKITVMSDLPEESREDLENIVKSYLDSKEIAGNEEFEKFVSNAEIDGITYEFFDDDRSRLSLLSNKNFIPWS